MIGFFPAAYEDELLYSQLCRYYQRTGYTQYVYALDDLFKRRTVHPSIEYVNDYTEEAMSWITREEPFEAIVEHHTMFPAYSRFLPIKRRIEAFSALVRREGNYHNLVVNQNPGFKRYLRYCPACAAEDRKKHGETYWHREHQIIRIDVCPKHRCYLVDSTVPLGSKETPRLHPAEPEIPEGEEARICGNGATLGFADYVRMVFRTAVDFKGDMPIGQVLQDAVGDAYRRASGIHLDLLRLYKDYAEWMQEICEVMTLTQFQKVLNGYSYDHHKILQISYFLRIPAEELCQLAQERTATAMEELYAALADRYEIPVGTVTEMGKAVISLYQDIRRVAQKSGPKQREWAKLDNRYYPEVVKIVDRIYNSGGKPGRVSVTRVEREFGAPKKQFQKLPKCTAYINRFVETNDEFRARRVTWAVNEFLADGRMITRNQLNHYLNLQKNDLAACVNLIQDRSVREMVEELVSPEG